MKKRFNLSKEIKLLLLKNQYYLKYNRNKKNSIYEENYHKRIKDPDGKIRDLTTEKKQKLRQLKYIVSYIKRKKPCKILDVGCGQGWLLSTLNSKWKKHGVEISPRSECNIPVRAELCVSELVIVKTDPN